MAISSTVLALPLVIIIYNIHVASIIYNGRRWRFVLVETDTIFVASDTGVYSGLHETPGD